jgi:hypothetical protein
MLAYKTWTVNQHRAQIMWLAQHVFRYRNLSAYLMATLNTLESELLTKAAKFRVGSVKC